MDIPEPDVSGAKLPYWNILKESWGSGGGAYYMCLWELALVL